MLQSSSDSAHTNKTKRTSLSKGHTGISYARILLHDVTHWESIIQSRITSARMEQKLFKNNLFFIRAEVILSVSPTDPPFEQQFVSAEVRRELEHVLFAAELLLDSSRSYPRLKHRFPVCHIAQQNTIIIYGRTAFTRRIAARLEHRVCMVCHLDICAELLLEWSRSYS